MGGSGAPGERSCSHWWDSLSGLIFGSFQFTHRFKYMVSVCVFDIWPKRCSTKLSNICILSQICKPSYVISTSTLSRLSTDFLCKLYAGLIPQRTTHLKKHNTNAQTGNRLLFCYRQTKTPNALFKESVADKCSNCCKWNNGMIMIAVEISLPLIPSLSLWLHTSNMVGSPCFPFVISS